MALILLISLGLGVIGGLYTGFYSLVVRVFRRNRGNVLLKVTIGMTVASTVSWFINPNLMGTATAIFTNILTDSREEIFGVLPSATPVVLAAGLMLILRLFASCITVGSGMSAGFLAPAALVGFLAAYAVANLFGISAGSPEYFGILAAGFSGILASTMNVPIAAAIMTVELFGAEFSFPAAFAAVIGFQVNRHRTIYNFAIAGSGHRRQ